MLNTNQEREAISNAHSHRPALRLIALGVLAAAIIAALLAHAALLTTVDVVHAQNQTQAQGWEGPVSSASSEVASAQAQGQVLITFDNIPIGAMISNQYPQAMFSSDASNVTVASDHFFGTSLPNISRRSLSSWNCCNGYAPLVVDFPNPLNDLAFHILAADNFGTIAWVEVYQNNVWTATQPVTGFGNPFSPIWYTGVSSYKNVTRIRITAISDTNGLAFDNLSFTIAPTPTPTPLPSPTPTPPPAPTNVNATPDENEIILSWTPSAGAASYIVNRTETFSQTNEMAAATEEGSTFAAIASSISCQPVNGRCFYEDTTANDSQTTYSYVVAATNSAGTSAVSNPPANASPLSNACSDPTKTGPTNGSTAYQGWTMQWEVSQKDGLVISEVYLNGKRMAKRMSVPYFRITTSKLGTQFGPSRGELTPAAAATGIRSRLVDYRIDTSDGKKIKIYAKYAVDRIPGTPKACLSISQQYEFYAAGASPPDLQGDCEPAGVVTPCHKFRPMIDYSFNGGPGESLSSLNMPIRLHFQNTDIGNTVALTRDLDRRRDIPFNLREPFRSVFNPLTQSWFSPVFVRKDQQHPDKLPRTRFDVDNFHQTNNKRFVSLPGLRWSALLNTPVPAFAGCPECVHFHWRWSNFLAGDNFRNGAPLLPPGSDQHVDIQINPYKGDEHPNDYYLNVFNPNDWLRNPTKGVNQPYDVVFWYSPTGFASHDTFFWHTAWFTPKIIPSSSNAASFSAEAASSATVQDGPVSVNFGAVYETGTTIFDSYDLSTMPPLPPGFAALNNSAYLIDTTAIVGGPHVVNFKADSVTDQTDFNNLRIFYAEPDPFDPEKPMWIDATILSPDSPAPNFSAKTLSARSEDLGVFVIGRLVQTPPPLGTANLRLSCTDSQDPITADVSLTYTVTVTNDGPQAATEVMLRNPLSPDVEFVSATPSQGTCKQLEGEMYCSLNTVAAGATATLTLLVKPTEGTVSFPPEGKMLANSAVVRANEGDNDPTNDLVTEGTTVLPSPNKPPTVQITSPAPGAMVVGPTNITITAIATDTDGTISKVEFFDNDELIGSGAAGAGNTFSVTRSLSTCVPTHSDDHSSHQIPCNVHTFRAVATDNGGRQNASTVDVIVNGSATVSITSPSPGALFNPGLTITLNANANSHSGISKVEFFANGGPIGIGPSFAWADVSAGTYSIVAVATDGSGITTTSTPINITVDTPPTVTMATPANGTVFPSLTNISVSATAQSAHGTIVRVDFYANDVLIASSSDVGTDRFLATWRHLQDGFYSIKAVATDNLGVSATSPAITIGVNTTSPQPGEFIWFDDALPAGAVEHGEDSTNKWYWVDANPGAFSGTKSHQSRSFGQLEPPSSFHQHYFEGATTTLPVNVGDKLFTYVFLDINNMPREIMLQWKDANGWEHRAYWGANNIPWGVDGTNSRRYMGPLPRAGTWVRLEVPASLVGLEGATLNGMAFTLDGGRATFDLAGKTTANAPPPPTTPPGDFIWVDDAVPAGSTFETVDDQWQWIEPHVCGTQGHRSFFTVNQGAGKFRSHSFRNASTTMSVNPGDVLFTYVYLDANHMPDQLMIQWHDGTGWEHRAFWGENYVGQKISNMGVQGTESQRYMGGIPPGNQWVRLEVPASYVGLEGKTVSGMAFGFYSRVDKAGINWDCSGKSDRLTGVPLSLSATSGVWRLKSNKGSHAYDTNDQGPPGHFPQKIAFYVHPNQAAGTVPFYRFRSGANDQFFYSRNANSPNPSVWIPDGIAFYVYPDAGTPGTVPLYLYHSSVFQYFLTIDQNEAAGMTFDGIWAYVYPAAGSIPAPPTYLRWDGAKLVWQDNALNETGFTIEWRSSTSPVVWTPVATSGPNAWFFKVGNYSGQFRVKAFNTIGESEYSNDACGPCPVAMPMSLPNTPPMVNISTPLAGEVVANSFAITANAFDVDGNGTVGKVEFFANGVKLGEVWDAPYVFVWNNVSPGTYTLTAVATDAAGATTTSAPVNVTVIGASSPYSGTPITIPGTIEAENFDNGVAEIAYHDTTPGSHGQDYDQPPNYPVPTFRQPSDVDMYKSTGYSNSYLLLGQAGDWTKYTVNVATTGTYTMQAQVTWGGTNGSPGTFHVEVDGVNKTGPIQIPDNNWAFTFVTKTGIELTAGVHVMRIVWATNAPNGYSGDIDYMNFSLNSGAFGGTPWSIPGTIEAENFDNGGAGIAYHDTTAGTHGQDYTQPPSYPPPAFRQPTDVDIYKSAGYSNSYLLLGQAGDWTKYSVNVATTGTYTLQAQVAWGGTSGSPGTFHIEVAGVDKTGPLQIPDTNWAFTTVTKTGVSLNAGEHVMRVVWDTNAPNGYSGDIDYLNFTFTGSNPYGGTPRAIPGTIEVENYDNGAAGVAYYDTHPGTHGQDYDQPPSYPPPAFRQPTDVDIYKAAAAYSNGYLIVMQAGDWMNYSVNVAQTGNYTLQARVAWGDVLGGTFHVEIDGVNKTGPIQMPNTNWTLQTITKTGVQLNAGQHVMRIVADSNGANGCMGDIDYVNFTLDSAAASRAPAVPWVKAQLPTPAGPTQSEGWRAGIAAIDWRPKRAYLTAE